MRVGLLNNGCPLVGALSPRGRRPPKSGMLISIMPYVRGLSVLRFGVLSFWGLVAKVPG